MRVLITGSEGFIGKNLRLRMSELQRHQVICFNRTNSLEALDVMVEQSDAIIHLAGVNRPENPIEFTEGNANLTERLCRSIKCNGRSIPLLFASSSQAALDNPYGISKLDAEGALKALAEDTGCPVAIYRLPNVFGKWCKPNYNSVVATFCHNIANDLPIQISDPARILNLVYVDDVVDELMGALDLVREGVRMAEVNPIHSISLGALASQITAFKNCRSSLVSERVGVGLVRALYATYVSYLTAAKFVYDLPLHGDERGVFVEMLKTQDSGQFSFFTARPGITRGGHYHHTKTEKFVVIKGSARFGFRHVLTGERYEVFTSGDNPQVVETVPGWIHDVTNIGDSEMVVMLWANEIFDREYPDTIANKV